MSRPPTFSSTERNFRRRVTHGPAEENLGLEKERFLFETKSYRKRGGGMEKEKGWGVKIVEASKDYEV